MYLFCNTVYGQSTGIKCGGQSRKHWFQSAPQVWFVPLVALLMWANLLTFFPVFVFNLQSQNDVYPLYMLLSILRLSYLHLNSILMDCFDSFETITSQIKCPDEDSLPGTISNDVIRVFEVIKSGHSCMFWEKKEKRRSAECSVKPLILSSSKQFPIIAVKDGLFGSPTYTMSKMST